MPRRKQTRRKNQTLEAWSPSRLNTYEQCPRKAKYLYIDGLKEPGNRFTEFGHEVHGAADQFIQGQVDEGHEAFGTFQDDIQALREQHGTVGRSGNRWMATEQRLALSRELEVVDWFGPEAWARMVFDVVKYDRGTVEIIDFKTGKVREKDYDQMDAYAWAAFHAYDNVDEVRAKLWYLAYGQENESLYRRDELPELQTQLEQRLEPYFSDTEFAPRPGPLCGWCHFSSKSGGNPKCDAASR